VMVVSATPGEALQREWHEHGLVRHVALIAGQELGSKREHLGLAIAIEFSQSPTAYFAFGSVRSAYARSNSDARLNQFSASPFRISFNWGSVDLSHNCVHRNAFSRHSIGSLGMTRGSAVTSQSFKQVTAAYGFKSRATLVKK